MASVEKYKSIRNCTSLETPGSVSFGKPRPPASGLVTGAGSHLQFALANSLPRVPAKCARGRMASRPARTAPGRPLSASFSTREHSLSKFTRSGPFLSPHRSRARARRAFPGRPWLRPCSTEISQRGPRSRWPERGGRGRDGSALS